MNVVKFFLSNSYILPGLKKLKKGEELQVFMEGGTYVQIYNSKGRQLYYHNPEE